MDLAGLIEKHQPWQEPWELAETIAFITRTLGEIKTILEIGTHRGGSARVWRDVFQPDLLVTVDKHSYVEGESDGITCVIGNSLEKETIRQVGEHLNGSEVDFLFIDGGHSYYECWGDYEGYGSFVRPGGIIGFHDIGPDASTHPKGCHVGLVWNELDRKGGRTVAFRKDQGTGLILL